MVFGLEALLFILLGLQLDSVVERGRRRRRRARCWRSASLLAALVIAVRVVFALLPLAPGLSLRERIVVGWCGMRGAISLAAALSIGERIDGRAEVDLPHVRRDPDHAGRAGADAAAADQGAAAAGRSASGRPEEAIARLEAAQSALDRLDELEDEKRIGEEPLRRLRDLYRARFRQCMAVIGGEKAPDVLAEQRMRFGDVRRDLIKAERAACSACATRARSGRTSSG